MHKKNYGIITFIMAVALLTLSNEVYSAGSIRIISGNKTLDWQQIESQKEFGFGFEFNDPEWPTAIIITYLNSEESAILEGFGGNIKATGETTEVGIGVRTYATENNVRFFIDTGMAIISVSIKLETTGESAFDSDSTMGFWFGAGADVMLGDMLSVGFFGRVSSAPVTLAGVDSNAGGTHFNIFAAYHF